MTETEPRFAHLVVIGASAGGVESLSTVVASLPRDFAAPIVIAQHLSPHRVSALSDILARRGPLPVRTISDQDKLEPGFIYVVPPNRHVAIEDHEVRLRPDGHGPLPSIDLLFATAAEVYGENVIAVVLSGSGSDGSAGARDVKQAGGTVIIENPDTTAYPSMPLSLAPSVVDIVANRERVGEILNELVIGGYVVPPMEEHSQLRTFLEEMRNENGLNFSAYKQPTIERRLQRRMAATGHQNFNDYVHYVRQHPEERQRLVRSFLIKVTEFFRDPELYTYLSEQVLPELIRGASERGGEVRIWSAGCATGEEAYSLAMAVFDLIGTSHDLSVRIFATDLDEDAVTFARRGIYSARSLSRVPQDVRGRHFVERGDDYEIRKHLRSLMVFGEHDLGQQAPFPRIDLVFCRNVLIYFNQALQRRALQLFAFSLRTGGYLVLGKSETVSPLAEFFAVDQPRYKVFRRIGDRAIIPPSRIREILPASPPPIVRATAQSETTRTLRPILDGYRTRANRHGEEALLGLPVAVVIMDHHYDIHHINSDARRIFGVHSAALDQDFIHLIQHGDALAVRKLIDESRASGTPITRLLMTGEDQADGSSTTLETTAFLIDQDQETGDALTVLAAIDVTSRERARHLQAVTEASAARLARSNEDVLATNQSLTLTITKLRAENEELLVAAEEIQAATEEVETLNEELQASNEELETLNEELQATVEELNTTNDDLQARTIELQSLALAGESARRQLRVILDSIDSAVAVVDVSGSIVIENAAFAAHHDLGHDATLRGRDGTLLPPGESPIARAARGEPFSLEFTKQEASDAMWFIAHGRPAPPDSGERLGVVTIREIPPPA